MECLDQWKLLWLSSTGSTGATTLTYEGDELGCLESNESDLACLQGDTPILGIAIDASNKTPYVPHDDQPDDRRGPLPRLAVNTTRGLRVYWLESEELTENRRHN